jgi:predicted phosphatase
MDPHDVKEELPGVDVGSERLGVKAKVQSFLEEVSNSGHIGDHLWNTWGDKQPEFEEDRPWDLDKCLQLLLSPFPLRSALLHRSLKNKQPFHPVAV